MKPFEPVPTRRRLLTWYRRHRRDLPWRHTRDPYAVWISETMLQQTRVETVIPYYERFLARFPDVGALATADLDDVLGYWAGLGYYSRARNLRAAAQDVVALHGGCLPGDAKALRALPGVGRYTAGAVASIAFDRPEPVVDGNVSRVLCRQLGIRQDPKSAEVRNRLWDEAEALARGARPGDLNQALMELGATICTPRSPACERCPLAASCVARAEGETESIPLRRERSEPRRVRRAVGLLARSGQLLAVRRPPEGLFGGLWELPGGDLLNGEKPVVGLRRHLREATGLELADVEEMGEVDHLLSHRRMNVLVFRARAGPGRVRRRGFDAHRWLSTRRIQDLPQGTMTRKVLRLALSGQAL